MNTGVMAIAEANYGRMDQSLRYVEFVADELDVEQPGALPELFPSPDYKYFSGGNPFGGAMVMQAWSSYGIHWPLVELYLGIKPDAPAKTLSVVPDLPGSWKELSIDNLHVGSDQIAVSVQACRNQLCHNGFGSGWLELNHRIHLPGQYPDQVGATE